MEGIIKRFCTGTQERWWICWSYIVNYSNPCPCIDGQLRALSAGACIMNNLPSALRSSSKFSELFIFQVPEKSGILRSIVRSVVPWSVSHYYSFRARLSDSP